MKVRITFAGLLCLTCLSQLSVLAKGAAEVDLDQTIKLEIILEVPVAQSRSWSDRLEEPTKRIAQSQAYLIEI
jgi:hypothetical protein